MIRIERDGEIIGRNLLRTLTDMMCDLREVSNEEKKGEGEPIYKSWWEEPFLDSTRSYYTTEAETNMERLSAPEFLERVERRLQEEQDRVSQYLHPTTGPLLFSLLDHVLISQNVQGVIDHPKLGLPVLLSEDRYTDLARMYKLFGRVGDGHTLMNRGIKVWLVQQGQRIVETAATATTAGKAGEAGADAAMDGDEPEASTSAKSDKGKGKAREGTQAPSTSTTNGKPAPAAAGAAARANNTAIEWVNAVLDLKDKMDKILSESFEKDKAFQNAINDVSRALPDTSSPLGLTNRQP
jgi:cullin 3